MPCHSAPGALPINGGRPPTGRTCFATNGTPALTGLRALLPTHKPACTAVAHHRRKKQRRRASVARLTFVHRRRSARAVSCRPTAQGASRCPFAGSTAASRSRLPSLTRQLKPRPPGSRRDRNPFHWTQEAGETRSATLRRRSKPPPLGSGYNRRPPPSSGRGQDSILLAEAGAGIPFSWLRTRPGPPPLGSAPGAR